MNSVEYGIPISNGKSDSCELVTFDLWLTLIKSDGTSFKDARNEMLRQIIVPEMDSNEFDALVRSADKAADLIAESRGADVLFEERINMITSMLGSERLTECELISVYNQQSALLEESPPVLIDPDTPRILDNLADNHKLAVISNTGFIKGKQMRDVLKKLGIFNFFDFFAFSDEVGYAKPHPAIFLEVLNKSEVAPQNSLHVGDNPRADIAGARDVGMQALHIPRGSLISKVLTPYV